MPSPFPSEPGILRVLEPAEGFDSLQLGRLRQGQIEQPFIIDTDRVRKLFFSLEAVQSSMALADPIALITPYIRKMMLFLLFHPLPQHLLIIGLGGGSLAKFCHRHLPRTQITVLEKDCEVIAMREAFAIPADDGRFRVIHMDAARYLAQPGPLADVVLLDAFDCRGVATELESSAFHSHLAERLTPKGLLVMNLSGEKQRYAHHVRHICLAFGTPVRLLDVNDADNVLLIASRVNLARLKHRTLSQRAVRLEASVDLPFRHYQNRLRLSEIVAIRR